MGRRSDRKREKEERRGGKMWEEARENTRRLRIKRRTGKREKGNKRKMKEKEREG